MHERERALRVRELAAPDQAQRVVEREPQHLDQLVVVGAARNRREVEGREEMDALVAEAGRRPDRPRAHQPPRPLPGLLGELARGARLGRLAGVELARRHLEDHAADRVPILADQQHLAIRDEGHHRGGARMPHDVEIEQRAVRKLDALGDRLDAEAAPDGLRVGGLAGRRHVSEGSPAEGAAMHGVPGGARGRDRPRRGCRWRSTASSSARPAARPRTAP